HSPASGTPASSVTPGGARSPRAAAGATCTTITSYSARGAATTRKTTASPSAPRTICTAFTPAAFARGGRHPTGSPGSSGCGPDTRRCCAAQATDMWSPAEAYRPSRTRWRQSIAASAPRASRSASKRETLPCASRAPARSLNSRSCCRRSAIDARGAAASASFRCTSGWSRPASASRPTWASNCATTRGQSATVGAPAEAADSDPAKRSTRNFVMAAILDATRRPAQVGLSPIRRPQPLAEVRMRDLDESPSPVDVPQRRQVDRAVLRDDPLDVVARRRHERARRQGPDDGRDALAPDRRRRLEANHGPAARRLAGAHDERLVSPHAGVLPAPDVIRGHLSGEVDRERPVDADEPPELPHERGVVHRPD